MSPLALSPAQQRFVEALGLYFERQGIPRIGGRILGLLLLTEEPLALGRIAALLQVSPASVSTNLRHFEASGLAEQVSHPGDRRHYYVFSGAGWEHRLRLAADSVRTLGQLCHQGLSALGERARSGRARLREAIEFCAFYQQEVEATARRWHLRRAPAPQRPPLPSRARARKSARK